MSSEIVVTARHFRKRDQRRAVPHSVADNLFDKSHLDPSDCEATNRSLAKLRGLLPARWVRKLSRLATLPRGINDNHSLRR